MTTAIIGLGNIGKALARHLAKGGEHLVLAARDATKARAFAKELGGTVSAAPIPQAIANADVVVFAVWFDTIKELISEHKQLLQGKVVVDPSNPIKPAEGSGFVRTLPDGVSSGSVIAAMLPTGSHFVKAFGTLAADALADGAKRMPKRAALFYATDDHLAEKSIERLVSTAGFEPVRAGGVEASLRIEVFGDLHQYGGLNGKVPDADEARAALSAPADGIARHWIDGSWRDSAHHGDSMDPATGEKIGRYSLGGAEEAQEAVAAALRAFRDTDWRTNRELRGRVLHEMAGRFEARAGDLARLISLENGKVAGEPAFEVGFAPPGFRYCASLVFTDYGRFAEWEAGRFSIMVREPMGVAGISVPWNSPVALLVRSLAPALAAGCTTVVKMPGQTAQVNALISRIFSETKSLPRGVINMVTGERDVLSHLVESPDVPTISFTGSTRTGRAILQAGAARLKRFGLELGGKTPMVVLDDADLDAALPKLEKALTVFAGQFCMTGSRLLVQKGAAEALRRRLAERLDKVKVGPASDPTSDMGPLIDRANVERVNRMVEEAIAAARVRPGQGRADHAGPLARGAFYRPTLLEVTDSRLPIVQQEVFGPVLTMQVFDTEAQAVALANDSEYGLAASVWSRDAGRALRVARAIQAGTVWINDWGLMPTNSRKAATSRAVAADCGGSRSWRTSSSTSTLCCSPARSMLPAMPKNRQCGLLSCRLEAKSSLKCFVHRLIDRKCGLVSDCSLVGNSPRKVLSLMRRDDQPPINQAGSEVKIPTGERRGHGTKTIYGRRDHRAVTDH